MKEYLFNMENIKLGKKKNQICLLQDGEDLYLNLKDDYGQEISRIKVLHISKIKKLTNFFIRGFNMPLEGKSEESKTIPEKELMEAERKIIVTGEGAEERVKEAIELLKKEFNAVLNRNEYLRKMVYLDTTDNQLRNNNMIFRLTQEDNDVKATIHMDNNLPGDQKHIIKFFFTDTSLPQVINFFGEGLSLIPITKSIPSKRTEFKSSIGEFAIDKVKDEHTEYYSIECELDNFVDENRDSKKIDEAAKSIASKIGLSDCRIVGLGTEAIYNLVSGQNYFEVYSNNNEQNR